MKQNLLLIILSIFSICFVNAQNNPSKGSDENNRVQILYYDGIHLYEQKNYKEAFEYFKKAANHGHAESIYYLGYCYLKGTGTQVDSAKAV